MVGKLITQQIILKIIVIAAMVSMSACSYARPNARILNQVPTGAPVTYALGWKDGCESGMALTGNQLYKVAYRNKIRPEMVSDPQYYKAWNEAKVYCAHYTMATQWEAGTLPKTPVEENTFFPEPQGILTVMASWGVPLVDPEGHGPDAEGFASLYH